MNFIDYLCRIGDHWNARLCSLCVCLCDGHTININYCWTTTIARHSINLSNSYVTNDVFRINARITIIHNRCPFAIRIVFLVENKFFNLFLKHFCRGNGFSSENRAIGGNWRRANIQAAHGIFVVLIVRAPADQRENYPLRNSPHPSIQFYLHTVYLLKKKSTNNRTDWGTGRQCKQSHRQTTTQQTIRFFIASSSSAFFDKRINRINVIIHLRFYNMYPYVHRVRIPSVYVYLFMQSEENKTETINNAFLLHTNICTIEIICNARAKKRGYLLVCTQGKQKKNPSPCISLALGLVWILPLS